MDILAKPACAAANCIPKPKQTGNRGHDSKMQFEYDAQVVAVNIVVNYNKVARDVADYARQALANAQRVELHGEDCEDASRLDAYDQSWKATYIAKKLGISTATVGKAKAKDSKIVNSIYRCLMNATGALPLSRGVR